MRYTVEIASDGMIHLPSFMKIGSGVQLILKLLPLQLQGCSVGITDERNL
jgi:hypothetical protein